MPCVSLPRRPRTKLGSAASLIRENPGLLRVSILRHVHKLTALLDAMDLEVLRSFLAEVPDKTLKVALPALLKGVRQERFLKVLAPLLALEDMHSTAADLLRLVDSCRVAMLVNEIELEKLLIMLRAPPEALAQLVSTIDDKAIEGVLAPVLREPNELLETTLVPLLVNVQHPERLSAVVNAVDADVMLPLLRGVPAPRLAALVDAFDAEDFEQEGAVLVLLKNLGGEPSLMEQKVLPLVSACEVAKLTPLVQGVKASQLLEVLRLVDVDGVVRILENTNAEFAVRLFNGPLEAVVSNIVGGLAEAVRNPLAASAMKQVTDSLNEGLTNVDKVFEDVRNMVRRGKEERGVSDAAEYKFGDFTRGLIADASIRGKDLHGKLTKAISQGIIDQVLANTESGFAPCHEMFMDERGVPVAFHDARTQFPERGNRVLEAAPHSVHDDAHEGNTWIYTWVPSGQMHPVVTQEGEAVGSVPRASSTGELSHAAEAVVRRSRLVRETAFEDVVEEGREVLGVGGEASTKFLTAADFMLQGVKDVVDQSSERRREALDKGREAWHAGLIAADSMVNSVRDVVSQSKLGACSVSIAAQRRAEEADTEAHFA